MKTAIAMLAALALLGTAGCKGRGRAGGGGQGTAGSGRSDGEPAAQPSAPIHDEGPQSFCEPDECVRSNCEAFLTECFGADWKRGPAASGGVCPQLMACTCTCEKTEKTNKASDCFKRCLNQVTPACRDCVKQKLFDCVWAKCG